MAQTNDRDPSKKPAKLLGAYIVIALLVAIAAVYFALGMGESDETTGVEQVSHWQATPDARV
jgi:hypothetical protein